MAMDCLDFFHTSQATYAMNENGLCFGRFAFFILFYFEEFFFIGTSKTKQNRKLKLQILGLL